MPYIVPAKLPKNCNSCPFCVTKFYHPFWSKNKPNTKGVYCSLDKQHKVLEMDIDEDLKACWCPLKEVKKND